MIIRTAASEQEVEQAIELYFINEPPPNPSYKTQVLDHWQILFGDCPEGFWIAEDELTGQIVGVTSAIRRPPQWLLCNFYILPAYHGRGIGRAMLSRAFATDKDCDRFAVHASMHHSAQSLYMQLGMYPLPYSIAFTGNPHPHLPSPLGITAETQPIDEVLPIVDAFDRNALGFSRVVDHRRWAKRGSYFLAKVEDQLIGYFQISPRRQIGPLVVSESRWTTAVLDLAINKQWQLSPGEQKIFVPGANVSALNFLLAHGFQLKEINLLLSSHPMPGLAQVIFHDTDFL